jgi:hypothetical protein
MSQPVLVVKVAANMTALRAEMKESADAILTTKRDMQQMASAFDGSRIISQANAVQAQISALGGVTNLTANEQRRANMVLDDALAKYKALGREAPPGMQALADATRAAGTQVESTGVKVGGLRGEMLKFDGILSSMGINLSAPIRAIGELGDFAGKSVTQVGLLGSAGAALGAGYAGWQVGRMIADFFDLDTKIGNATAKLLGYGDVAAQEAGAGADALNGKLSYQANLLRQAAQATGEQTRELSELEKAWNASAEATGWAADEGTILGDVRDGIIQTTGEAIAAEEAYRSGLVFTTEVIAEQTEAKKADTEATEAAIDAMKVFSQTFTSDIAPLSANQIANLRGNSAANMLSGSNGDENLRAKLAALEAEAGSSERGLFRNVVTRDQYMAAQEKTVLLAQLRQYFAENSFADGVTNFRGGMALVGERGPELVNLPRGSSVTPNHQLGGGTLNLTLNLNGPAVGNFRELAQMVGAEVMRTMRGQGFREPVGA